MPDRPGCSLVASIEHARVRNWLAHNPAGTVISYINTDAETKALSHYICTSRNAPQVLDHAARAHPRQRILFLPDKYLGAVSLSQSKVDPSLVDLYDGACHVHAKLGELVLEDAFDEHPDAELLIHPECGCASSCLAKIMNGSSPYQKAYFLSTEQMVRHAHNSPVKEFIVATEMGMLYRLRKNIPDKIFYPVSREAVCEYMKMNTLEKLLDSLQNDRVEVSVDREIRNKAQVAIQRMLTIH